MRKSMFSLASRTFQIIALSAAAALAAAPVSVVNLPTQFMPAGFTFDSGSGLSNRMITPNGDRLNDFIVFTFGNPRDSAVTGTIYDIKGTRIAGMSTGPTVARPNGTLQWDGKANGRAVDTGLYVYVIEAEDKVYNGLVVVIK